MDRVKSSGFPTTAWTVVSRARKGAGTEARDALAFLCTAYWLPLYSFARRLGNATDEAPDRSRPGCGSQRTMPDVAQLPVPERWRLQGSGI